MVSEKVKREAKLHFNFITLHYFYILGMSIILSIIVYLALNIPYIDALFFATGSCTQSGLNTIDTNTLDTYQQVFLYIFPMFTSPIFVNTCVVYVRLRWFEKRFKSIVKMSRLPSRARTASQDPRRTSIGALERGVGGRNIRVLHQDPTPVQSAAVDGGVEPGAADGGKSSPGANSVDQGVEPTSIQQDGIRTTPGSGKSSSTMAEPIVAEGLHSANESPPATRGSNLQFNLPSPRDGAGDWSFQANHHIAFLENQKAPQHDKALRIPGPREFENGDRAREVDDDDTHTLGRSRTAAEDGVSSPPARSYSFAGAATNASSFVRLRRLPSVLPPAQTVLSTAFSPGTAQHRKRHRLFPRKPTKEVPMPYLSYQPTVGRNSEFVNLTDEQRDELGGIEYRSLKLLGRILWGYYFFFHIFGVLCIMPWIFKANPQYRDYIRSFGIHPAWWALFTSQSSFNDVGFTLTPDSMISFQNCTWLLLIMSFLIVIGNTGFPCMLRFIIWVSFKIVPKDSAIKESLNFLLDHPRRCFTLLFPSRETWVLFWVLIGLNLTDVILFIVLDLKDSEIEHFVVGHRIVAAIFQAVSTRTAGLSVVSIAALHPAVQVSYMFMMYISVFPIAISVRRTNVYEEKSLGLYSGDDREYDDGTGISYVGTHLRKQLSFDLWYIFLGLFIICIAEGGHIESTAEYAFTIFSVLFEIISAYGTVGLSLGYPNLNTSFSSKFNTVSKLVIIAMQVRGRHRGLPYELDRAVLLPKEQRDSELMSIRRRSSTFSQAPPFSRPFAHRVPSQAVEDD
ncbi:cation transport protein-domain-containing protein [Trichophaea hybrida]|nr:cation transport protein-domain-containing protein [Trichophaea hybrida]